MYKCYECGHIFEESNAWTETHGEPMSGCPNCGGAYEEATDRCHCCDNLFLTDEDFTGGWCIECAKGAFTLSLGEEYLNDNDLWKEFIEYNGERYSAFMLDVYHEAFRLENSGWGVPKIIMELKEFCFDDMDTWTSFLNKKGA